MRWGLLCSYVGASRRWGRQQQCRNNTAKKESLTEKAPPQVEVSPLLPHPVHRVSRVTKWLFGIGELSIFIVSVIEGFFLLEFLLEVAEIRPYEVHNQTGEGWSEIGRKYIIGSTNLGRYHSPHCWKSQRSDQYTMGAPEALDCGRYPILLDIDSLVTLQQLPYPLVCSGGCCGKYHLGSIR